MNNIIKKLEMLEKIAERLVKKLELEFLPSKKEIRDGFEKILDGVINIKTEVGFIQELI